MKRADRRIVIAHDFEIFREGLRSVISTCPEWTVVGEAYDAKSAVFQVRTQRPDIAIVDNDMPGMSIFKLIPKITRAHLGTEVLILAHHGSVEGVRKYFAAGARGLVLKNQPGSCIVEAVRSLAVRMPYLPASLPCTEVVSQQGYAFAQKRNFPGMLTNREIEIVRLIGEGSTNMLIASGLRISVKTVETHRASIMRKLDLRTVADLVRYAVRNGIVEA